MTDFGHYWAGGTGRDSYISSNNGGLRAAPLYRQENPAALREYLSRPEQKILLPSYAPTPAAMGLPPSPRRSMMPGSARGLSVAAEAELKSVRRDPVLRAKRAHQRRVAQFMHTSRGSTGGLGKTARQAVVAQASAGSFGLPGDYLSRTADSLSLAPVPSWPANRQQVQYMHQLHEAATTFHRESKTARNPLSSSQPIGHHDYRVLAQAAAKQQRYAAQGTVSPRKLRPLAQQQQQYYDGFGQSGVPSLPLAQQHLVPLDAATQSLAAPGPFQQTMAAEFMREEAHKRALEAERQRQATTVPAPTAHVDVFAGSGEFKRPSPPPMPRSSPWPTHPSLSGSGFVSPPPLPSHHVTLPRNSAYIGRGMGDGSPVHEPRVRDYNLMPAAGYSALEKQRKRGMMESDQPLLG